MVAARGGKGNESGFTWVMPALGILGVFGKDAQQHVAPAVLGCFRSVALAQAQGDLGLASPCLREGSP